MTLLERTVARIVFGHPMECWPWTGATPSGYGKIKHDNVWRYAHRVMFEAFFGPIAPGLEVDHLCEFKGCCNPWHMEAVPHRENMRRWMSRATRVGSSFVRRAA